MHQQGGLCCCGIASSSSIFLSSSSSSSNSSSSSSSSSRREQPTAPAAALHAGTAAAARGLVVAGVVVLSISCGGSVCCPTPLPPRTSSLWRTIHQALGGMLAFQLANLLWLYFGYELEFQGLSVFLQLAASALLFAATQVGLVVFFCLKIRTEEKKCLSSFPSEQRVKRE
ncbi:hypothetical protein Efla_003315 [Eimeria flavescens]